MSKALDLFHEGPAPRNPFGAQVCQGVAWSEGAALDGLPYPDACFDYMTCSDLLRKLSRLGASIDKVQRLVGLMNEVHRVLKPGGIVWFDQASQPWFSRRRATCAVGEITEQNFSRYWDQATMLAGPLGLREGFDVCAGHAGLCGGRGLALMRPRLGKANLWPLPRTSKISVVIPVYNGAAYLPQTLASLYAQTHRDFEVLCVDDCSRDDSLAVLQAEAAKDARVRVIRTPENFGGAPKVLNFSLPLLTGSYFVYASQDDLFSVDWLEKMLARAQETGADAVLPTVTYYYENQPERNKSLVGVGGNTDAVLSGQDAVMKTLGWDIPGNALWNVELIKGMGFSDFALNADEFSVRRFFNVCNKVVFSGGEFLYRQDNAGAITKKITPRYFDFSYTHLRLARWLFEQGYPRAAVLKELRSARKGMAFMVAWLKRGRYELTDVEQQDVATRIARFQQLRKSRHPFGSLPRRYWRL
ncbi:MAG: glycosyltransferase [Burkholderiales bacterium]|nr:glycosyltransferase [Burkholderiales bacterium]